MHVYHHGMTSIAVPSLQGCENLIMTKGQPTAQSMLPSNSRALQAASIQSSMHSSSGKDRGICNLMTFCITPRE